MQAPADGLDDLVAHSVRELESMSRDDVRNNQSDQDFEVERSAKVPKTGTEPAVGAGLRHVQTEQRRRDRINEGFAALKALMPSQEKMDKATFLNSTVVYIKQLQGVMQQLVSMGAVNNLPEEAQWNIRVLLPRKTEPSVAPFTVPAAQVARPAAPAVDPSAATAALLGMLLSQPNQLAVNTQQGQGGLDIAQLVQQAAFSQQLQAQQNQLLQALQMQHLFQAAQTSTGVPAENVSAPGSAVAPNMGQVLPANSLPQPVLLPPMTVGCHQAAPANVLPKARKNGKVRRHTTAARIPKPAADLDAPAVDVGRPAPTEVAN